MGDNRSTGALRRRHAWLKSLFHAARDAPDRQAYVADLRANGISLADDVSRLIKQHEATDGGIEPTPRESEEPQAFQPSQLVAGRFRVVRLIGRGGMGEVYEAIDLVLRQPVALKTIRPDFADDHATRARFFSELQLARRVTHPNVCRMYELWPEDDIDKDSCVFLTMELLEGETLAETLGRDTRLAPERALPLLEQLAAALVAIHRLNIIHRDLKPSNVYLVPGGPSGPRVVVTDFGLARKTVVRGAVTHTAALAGTPAYMAPEQFAASECSVATDIYAFGVICFEMVTGQRHPLVPARTITPHLNSQWEQFILRCVAQDPRKRPPNADALLTELHTLRTAGRRIWMRRAAVGLSVLALSAVGIVGATRLIGSSYGLVQSPEFTRLTFDPGLTCEPSASADGRRVVYSSDRADDGVFQVWLHRLPEGDRTQLTHGVTHAVNPTISPDGRFVAFRSEGNGGAIHVMSTEGGPDWTVATFGRHPRFSPDGTQIVYWTGVEGDHALASGKLWVVSTLGGRPRLLHPNLVDARFPAWSPDGRLIVFRASATPGPTWDEGSDWWVTDVEGTHAAPIGAFARFAELRLSLHDGGVVWHHGQIEFSARAGHSTNLWSLPVSDKTGRVLGPPQRLTTGSNLETSPWPLANDSLAYTNWEVSAQIWRVWTTGERAGAAEPLTATDALDTRPVVSADGARLMFTRRLGEVRNLWIKDVATGSESLILPGTPLVPALSVDGQYIAYSVRDNLKRSIYVIRPPDGTRTLLCENCGEVQGWSPGAVLYLRQLEGTEQSLESIAVATKQTHMLVRGEGLSDGTLSPSDAVVAFAVREEGLRSRIYLAPVRAGAGVVRRESWRPLTAANDWADKPRWSPDGRFLYFYSERDGFGCIWRQEMHEGMPTGEPTVVKHLHEAQHAVFHLSRQAFALSVGRDFVVYNVPSVKGNVWIMSQFEAGRAGFSWLLDWFRGDTPSSR